MQTLVRQIDSAARNQIEAENIRYLPLSLSHRCGVIAANICEHDDLRFQDHPGFHAVILGMDAHDLND